MNKVSGYQLKRISFVAARNPDAHSINAADLGLIPLNDPLEPSANAMGRANGKPSAAARNTARRELFKEGDISMTWSKMHRVGSGFSNLGNTCFMNSVLQCLLHTAPLAELLLSGRPLASNGSNSNGFDPITITRQLLQDSLASRRDYVSPQHHAKTLKRINRSFKIGRQEDAHEYLIALLDAMHERSIAGINPKPPPDVEFTSFVYRIFGGRIRSQVKCTQCNYESNTYDPFLDLSLEINHAQTVQRALQRFTAGESLDGANKYKCPKQNRPVRAVKRMTIEEAPKVLIIQLKRFEFSLSGRKISKPVAFDEVLDLSPFMSTRPAVPALYDLYGVLVHQGHSMHSGHYYCFLKGVGSGEWHKFDDTRVHTTSARNVLGQLPYILFYIKRTSATPQATMPQQPAALAESRNAAQRERALQPSQVNKRQRMEEQREEQRPAAKKENSKKRRRQEEQEQEPVVVQRRSNAMEVEETDADDSPPPRKTRRTRKQQQQQQMDEDVGVISGREPTVRILRHRHATLPRSPVALGRRGKRLAEQKMLWQSVSRRANNSNSKPSSPTPPKRRNVVESPTRPASTATRKASDKERSDDASFGSAVSAPDWPPVKSTRGGGKSGGKVAATAATAPASTRKADKAAVNDFLRAGVQGVYSLGVDAWEETEVAEKRRHDRLLRRAAPGRKAVDEYDAEYDRGKLKKVKNKDRVNGTVDSRAFDAALKNKKKPGEMMSGKKRQRQMHRGS